MSEKIATIYDVARVAGISIATVSRVLNSPEKVRPATKDKVFNTMKMLNFTPKADARARAKKNIGRIGVITFNMNSSFSHRLKGISSVLETAPFELIIITKNNIEDIDYYLRSINLTDKLDGLIIISHKLNDSTLKLLDELSIKAVFIEFGEDNFTSVTIDNTKGGKIIAEYLIDKSYNSFAVLTEKEDGKHVLPNQMRVSGFIERLNTDFPSINNKIIHYAEDNIENGIKKATKILNSSNPPEVIFATTDLLAVATLKAAKKLNISIPDELGIIGFDGTDIADYMDITTVDQSLQTSGKTAAELLLKTINEPNTSVKKIILPLKIIERDTIK